MRARILAGVAVVGLVGALFAVGATSVSEPDTADARSDREPSDRDELDEAAQDLLALLEQGRTVTYHAVYSGSSPEVDGAIRLETWQAPPQVRQDTELQVRGQVVRTRTIGNGTGVVRCAQLDATWSCRRASAAEDPLGPVSQATVDQITRGSVAMRHTTVDGRPVRCYTLRTAEGTSELCATEQGIVVRVSAADSLLQLESLEFDVSDELFEPPAEVQG